MNMWTGQQSGEEDAQGSIVRLVFIWEEKKKEYLERGRRNFWFMSLNIFLLHFIHMDSCSNKAIVKHQK